MRKSRYCLRLFGARWLAWNTLQQSSTEYLVQMQMRHVDIADMAATCLIAAQARTQCRLKARLVDIPNGGRNEVAAPHGAIAIDRDDRLASVAGHTLTGMTLVVDRKERVNRRKAAQIILAVVVGQALV